MSQRTLQTLLLLMQLSAIGCSTEVSNDEPADELSAELLPVGDNATDFQLAMIAVDYNPDGHVYKSPAVGTQLLSKTQTNTWSDWTALTKPNNDQIGVRLGLLLSSAANVLNTHRDFQICLRAKDGVGATQCTPWASEIGDNCPQTQTGFGCNSVGYSDTATTADPFSTMPKSYSIGMNVRSWSASSKRALYNFAIGGAAVCRDPKANCDEPLFGCLRTGTQVETPSTVDLGGWTPTVSLDSNQTNLKFQGIQLLIHTWYADNP